VSNIIVIQNPYLTFEIHESSSVACPINRDWPRNSGGKIYGPPISNII